MGDDTFRATVEKVGQVHCQGYVEKLYNPNQKSKLPKFLAGAVVKASKCSSLTEHVIQSVSNDILSHLYLHRQVSAKYPPRNDEKATLLLDVATHDLPCAENDDNDEADENNSSACLLYTSPSPRDA